jgi:hypothetical protein
MRKFCLSRVLRLAVIVLLALNVVPEALAAFPVCKYDFGKAQSTAALVNDSTAVRHSHGPVIAHECMATMPDRQSVAHQGQFSPDHSVILGSALLHPAAVLVAKGPSPRGSPAKANAYLLQRSSVLLLI